MAMTPAEPSRPRRKWPSSGPWVEEPFWAGVVILLFFAGLIVLAQGALAVSRMTASGGPAPASDFLPHFAVCVLGIAMVVGLLMTFAQHPRTRSDAATASFRIMKTLMFVAGIVLFLGGALQIIRTTEFAQQIALALLSLFYVVTPLSLHFVSK